MHRNRWSTLYLLLGVFLGSGCGNREHRVVGPRAGSSSDLGVVDNPGSAGTRPALPSECRGSGLCVNVLMANDSYSECYYVAPPLDPSRQRVSCEIIWSVVSQPQLPFSCDQLPFAESVDRAPRGSMSVTCSIRQLAVTEGKPEPGDGFYWMDAAHVDPPCTTGFSSPQGRIMYTPGAMPVVPGSHVETWLDCS